MNRKAVNAWLEMRERNVFFRGMTAWMGFTKVQVPFEVVERQSGKSSWSYVRRLKLALIGITTFSSLPLHIVTMMGLLLGLSVLHECEAATASALRAIQEKEVEQSSAQLVSGHSIRAIQPAPQSIASCIPIMHPMVKRKD